MIDHLVSSNSDLVRVNTPNWVRDPDDPEICKPEIARCLICQLGHCFGGYQHRWTAGYLKFHRVVDTPRRTTTSISGTSKNQVNLFGQ